MVQSEGPEHGLEASIEDGPLRFTRRALIGGVGAALVASGLPAHASDDDLTLTQEQPGGRVVVSLGKHPTWTLSPTDYGDEAVLTLPPQEQGATYRRLLIDRANWPGGVRHGLNLRFELVGGAWRMRLSAQRWLRPAPRFSVVDLARFLDGDADARPAAPLTPDVSRALLRSAFGPRVRRSGNVTLSFVMGNRWALATDASLALLANQVSVARLEIRREAVGAGDLASARPRGAQPSSLVGEGTPSGTLPEIVMGGERGVVKLTLKARDAAKARAVVRQWGRPVEAIEGLAYPFDAWLEQDGVREGPFLASTGSYWRGSDRGGRFERFAGQVDERDFAVSTRFSGFVVRGRGATAADQISGLVRDGRVCSFEALCDLTHATLALPNVVGNGEGDPAATSQVGSRLDFDGPPVAFTLPTASVDARQARVLLGRPQAHAAVDWDAAPVQIPLDHARLRVTRAHDLLALRFRFRDLVLQVRAGGARLSPKDRSGAVSTSPDGVVVDTRPILVVDFAPQHVMERAYYRQLDADLPGSHLPCQDVVDALTTAPAEERVSRRKALQAILATRSGPLPPGACWTGFERAPEFVELARYLATLSAGSVPDPVAVARLGPGGSKLAERWRALPADQQVYLGPDPRLLDPDAAGVALAIRRAMLRPDVGAGSQAPDVDAVVVGRLPDVPLPAPVLASLRRDVDTSMPGATEDERHTAYEASVEGEKSRRDPDYAGFARVYERLVSGCLGGAGSIEVDGVTFACPIARPPVLPQEVRVFRGRKWYVASTGSSVRPDVSAYVRAVVCSILAELATRDDALEGLETVTQARLSGASRLAFRINCDDGYPGKAGGIIPFSLDGLTDWSSFDLAVARRAEVAFLQPGGRLPVRGWRTLERDQGAILAHQGIAPGGGVEARLDQIRRSLTEPGPFETAIEIPARLVLSPSQRARFRLPRLTPKGVFDGDARDPTPIRLWSAAMEQDAEVPDVRAIWSPDLRVGVLGGGTQAPTRGPWAPWSPDRDDPARERFRTSLDAYDRHELVLLSSTYGLPVLGRRDLGGALIDASQIEPPKAYRLRGLERATEGDPDQSAIYVPQPLGVPELTMTALGGSLDLETTFTPPAAARDAAHATLFPSLSIDRWRHRTVLGRDVLVEVVYKGFLFPIGIPASLVKSTERRLLANPSGGHPTAYLIQRMFLRLGRLDKSFPAMGQPDGGRAFPCETVHFLTSRTPDLVDPLPKGGVEARYPDPALDPESGWALVVGSNGHITIDGKSAPPGLMFWPRLASGPGGDVPFQVQLDGDAGAVSMNLVFVDNVAANEAEAIELLTGYYNQLDGPPAVAGRPSGTTPARRTVDVKGTPRRYANERKPGDTTQQTLSWVLAAQGRLGAIPRREGDARVAGDHSDFSLDPAMEGADQPPFYPVLERGLIRLTAVERFVGRELRPVWARLDGRYVAHGLPLGPATGEDLENYLVLEEAVPIDMGEAGNRSSGMVRPAGPVRGISRVTGIVCDADAPVPVGLAKPVPTSLDAKGAVYLGKGFKLLGIVDMTDLVKTALTPATAPKLTEVVEYGVSATNATADTVAATVRTSVIEPLQGALASVKAQWLDAAAQVSSRTGKTVELTVLYPGVSAGLDDMTRVAEAVSRTADGAALLLGLGTLYESGRRFVAELDRIARDPIGPLREKAKNAIRSLGGKVLGLVEALRFGWAAALRTALAAVVSDVVDRVFTPGSEAAALADLLVALPLVGPVFEGYGPQVRDALRSFAKDVVTAQILSPGTTPDVATLTTTLGKISERAKADGRQEVVDAVDALGRDVNERLTKGVAGIAGPLYDVLLGGDAGLVTQARAAATAIEAKLRSAELDALGKVMSAIADGFSVLDQAAAAADLLRDYGKLCEDLVGRMLELARSIRDPVPLKDLVHALEVLDAGSVLPHTRPLIDRLRVLVARFETARAAAAGRLDDAAKACVNAADLPSQAIGELLRARTQAIPPLLELAAALSQDLSAATAPAAPAAPIVAPAPAAPPPPTPPPPGFVKAAKTLVAAVRSVAGLGARPPAWIAGTRDEIGHIRSVLGSKPYRSQLDKTLLIPAENWLDSFEAASTVAFDALKQADALLDVTGATLGDLRDALAAIEHLTADATVDGVKKASVGFVLAEVGGIERLFAFAASARAKLGELLHAAILAVTVPAAKQLSQIHAAAMTARRELVKTTPAGSPAGALLGSALEAILIVPPPGKGSGGLTLDDDYLASQSAALARIAAFPDAATDAQRIETLTVLEALAADWRRDPPALALLARNVERAVAALLRGDVAAFLDVQAARREIEALIKRLVPSRVRRSYDFKVETEGVGELLTFRSKDKKGAIIVAVTGEIDLLDPTVQPRFDVLGTIDPFSVKLLPAFDVATLHFKAGRFSAGTGRSSDFKIDIEKVDLGEKVKFLKQLEKYIGAPKDGSGFYVQSSTRRLGLVAGYKLALPPFNIGNLGFSNVSLNCACDLPYGDADAQFAISVGRPEVPVLVAAAPYAGTGYIGLIANAHGIVGFEASLEYGGGGVFSFGPLTGEGRVTAGVFVRNVEGYTSLYGLFYAGGSARIACFSTSTSFCLRLGQDERGDLVGSAVYTFSFSLGFVDVSFAITVWKTESSGNGRQVGLADPGRTRYAALQSSTTRSDARPSGPGETRTAAAAAQSQDADMKITLANSAVCQSEHFGRYASYFDLSHDVELMS